MFNNENNNFNNNVPNAPLFSNEFNNPQQNDNYTSYPQQDGLLKNSYDNTIQNSNDQVALFSNEFKPVSNEYDNSYQNIPPQNNNMNSINSQTPLFSGNNYNTLNQVTNSYQNNNMNSINPQTSLFSGNNSNTLNQVTNSYQNNEPLDVPPQLSEIKNLSDATISYAPTMDVLDPMNIMPEEKTSVDPLEAYDNGYLNSNMNINPSDNQINNNPNSISLNNNVPLPKINNNTYYNTNTSGTLINNSNPLIFNNNQDNLNTKSISNLIQPNNNFNTNVDLSKNLISQPTTDLDNNHFSIQSNEESNPDNNINQNKNNNVENTSLPYEIIQNKSLNKDTNENESSFLGLDDEFNNDSLNMVEINDNVAKEERPEEITEKGTDALERIKALIDNLNKEGKKVDIQEFDFDNLVQLVIKIYN